MTFKTARPFTWKETPCVVSPWESIVSSLCEDFCVLCLRISAHCEAPSQPLAHLLCIMSDYCQSHSPARGAKSERGLLTAAERSDLSSSRASVRFPWCRAERGIPASQPCAVSGQAERRRLPTPVDVVVSGCAQALSTGEKQS